jgi:curved DNA binding protein
MKKDDIRKEEEDEEVEEIEEVEEEEDQIGEDFAKDTRAWTLWADAGKIADSVLDYVIAKVKVDANIYELCVEGDNHARSLLNGVFNKKKYTKGLAFPTSVSVNEICGNYSPTSDDVDSNHITLKQGDVVKIDLGVHINGFAAVVAHTVVCGEDKVTGRKADVILAAYNALHAGLRLLTAKKNTNSEITKAFKSVTDSYNCTGVEGVLSHKMKRDIVDGFETIICTKTGTEHQVDIRDFDHGDVYGLDVIVSTGEGTPKESPLKCTVYKRALETTYKLKIDSSRKLLSVVEHNFYNFPFSMNSFDNVENVRTTKPIDNLKKVSKMGLTECVAHELFYPLPVLQEKKEDIVAHFKYTVAVRNDGPYILAGKLLDVSKFSSECKIEDESTLSLLAQNIDNFLPNSKKLVKVEKKKDNKAKKALKKANKEKRVAEGK